MPLTTHRTAIAATLFAVAALTACSPDTKGGGWTAAASNGNSSRISAGAALGGDRAAFTGTNGTAAAGGHTLQARDGRLSLDGDAYGQVGATTVSELQLRDGKARVLVDGQERGAGAAD